MRIAIHQPHYFPWLGYFDKIGKADTFVLLDCVQFEKGSQMIRNRVLSDTGEIKYITISADIKHFLEREYRDIRVKNPKEWKNKQINALMNYYRKAKYREEGLKIFEDFLSNDYQTLCEWTCESIRLVCRLLNIGTKIVYQSEVGYKDEGKKSNLVLAICKALKSECYFSGQGGSVAYLDKQKFAENGISIEFQEFVHPVYRQCGGDSFVPGLSVLDMFLNCGIEKTKKWFWENCKAAKESYN